MSETCTCANLRQATRAVTQLFDEALRPTGLRATQFTLLIAIARLGAITMTDLASTMVMDRTTLSRNIKPLVDRGLVDATPGLDRRSRVVALAPDGDALIARALPLWERAQTRMVQTLGNPTWTRLIDDLRLAVDAASGTPTAAETRHDRDA